MMQKAGAVGLFSWLKALESSFFEHSLKISLIWFDRLVMQSPSEDVVRRVFPSVLDEAGASDSTREVLCGLIDPVQHHISDYEFASPEVWDADSHISASTHTALEEFFEDRDGPWPKKWWLHREVALTGCGVIDALNLVCQLSAQFPCCLIPADCEHRVITEIIRPHRADTTFDLFKTVAEYRLPNLTQMSWDRVAEVRHHRFTEHFRQALSRLQSGLASMDAKELQNAFTEMERKSLKELLSILSPSIPSSVAKGIVTNLPLPIPINPAGVYDAISSVRKGRMIADKYGWLYFLYELS